MELLYGFLLVCALQSCNSHACLLVDLRVLILSLPPCCLALFMGCKNHTLLLLLSESQNYKCHTALRHGRQC